MLPCCFDEFMYVCMTLVYVCMYVFSCVRYQRGQVGWAATVCDCTGSGAEQALREQYAAAIRRTGRGDT
jgi:hypothetical protein